jgi:ABC-2 type transport system permease protein
VSGLFAKTLRDQRRALIGWGVGLFAMATMYAAFYPSVRKSASGLQIYLKHMPDALKSFIGSDYTSPAGYLRGEVFSILGPVLLLVFAIGAGARAVAGEEEAGTLDLLLSTPIRRRQVLVDKAVAMGATTVALVAILWVAILAFGPVFGLHVAIADVASACVMLLLLAMSFGAVAFALGCATGHRGPAIGITGGLAVCAFIVNGLAPTVHALHFLRPLSPFRWYLDPDPLLTGLHPLNVVVLVGVAAVALMLAWVTFERRDLAA